MATLVGKKFPDLNVDAMNEMGDTFKLNILDEAVNNKKKVLLFWYPKDFTFVCPTELHAFQASLKEFEKRNTMVIGASCDTNEVHFAWLNTPKNNGGIEGVTYPLLADTTRNLSNILGILDIDSTEYSEETDSVIIEGSNVTFRATYLIDETGKIFIAGIALKMDKTDDTKGLDWLLSQKQISITNMVFQSREKKRGELI